MPLGAVLSFSLQAPGSSWSSILSCWLVVSTAQLLIVLKAVSCGGRGSRLQILVLIPGNKNVASELSWLFFYSFILNNCFKWLSEAHKGRIYSQVPLIGHDGMIFNVMSTLVFSIGHSNCWIDAPEYLFRACLNYFTSQLNNIILKVRYKYLPIRNFLAILTLNIFSVL